MRFRSSALAMLGALAIVAASLSAHGHADRGPALDQPCAVCAIQSHNAATCSDSPSTVRAPQQLSLELFSRAPVARPLRTHGSAAPRGPPQLTA